MGKQAKDPGRKIEHQSSTVNGYNGSHIAAPLGELLLFARTFLKYPNMVGWMLPSSQWVVNHIVEEVDWDQASLIVEYGPGLGTITTKLLDRMRPDARLIALEINPIFATFLKKQLHDPRLRIIERSATEIAAVLAELGFSSADYVISGVPFKTMPHPVRDEIVRSTHGVLRPRGRFLVYQLSSVVLPYLEDTFQNVQKTSELLSFMPARVFSCAR